MSVLYAFVPRSEVGKLRYRGKFPTPTDFVSSGIKGYLIVPRNGDTTYETLSSDPDLVEIKIRAI